MTALPSKHSGGCHMAAEEEADQRTTSGREIWRMRCGQKDTSTAGGRWRWQHRAGGGRMGCVAYAPPKFCFS